MEKIAGTIRFFVFLGLLLASVAFAQNAAPPEGYVSEADVAAPAEAAALAETVLDQAAAAPAAIDIPALPDIVAKVDDIEITGADLSKLIDPMLKRYAASGAGDSRAIAEATKEEENRLAAAKAATAKYIQAAKEAFTRQLKAYEDVSRGYMPEEPAAPAVDETVRSIEDSVSRLRGDSDVRMDLDLDFGADKESKPFDSTQTFNL